MKKLNLWVVDSDPESGENYRKVLESGGFDCELVSSAEDAVEKLVIDTPDLMLMDMRLGQGITIEYILSLVRSNPRFDRTRVFVITAYPELAEPLTHLADLILFKPVDIVQLKTLIERFISYGLRFRDELFCDPVTGSFSQNYFLSRLDQAFERARRRKDFLFGAQVFELSLVQEDQQKVDPNVRTKVLRSTAQRLHKHLRNLDTVARFSGNTFVTLHEELKHASDIQVIINRMTQIMAMPFQVDGEAYYATIRLGAAVHDSSYKQPDDVLHAAEQALERARLPGAAQVQIAA